MELVESPARPRHERPRATPDVVLLVGSEDTMGGWDRALVRAGYAPLLAEAADEGLAMLTRYRHAITLALLGPDIGPARRQEFIEAMPATHDYHQRTSLIVLVSKITVEEMVTLLRLGANEVLPADTLTERMLIEKLAHMSCSY